LSKRENCGSVAPISMAVSLARDMCARSSVG
jgi:hypothetical protein